MLGRRVVVGIGEDEDPEGGCGMEPLRVLSVSACWLVGWWSVRFIIDLPSRTDHSHSHHAAVLDKESTR